MNLQYANSPAGRWLLGVKNTYPIVKITPNSYIQLIENNDGKLLLQGTFKHVNFVERLLAPIEEQIKIANEYKHIDNPYKAFLHYAGLERGKFPSIYLNSLVVKPNGTGSGGVNRIDEATWSAAHDAGTGDNANINQVSEFIQGTTSGGLYYVNRVFIPIDTSALGAGFNATAATLQITEATNNRGTGCTAIIVQSTQGSFTTLTTSDFTAIGTTAGSDVITLNQADGTTKTFTLNATGIGWITASITPLGIRDNANDIPNTTPVALNDHDIYMGTSGKEPTLTITFTPGNNNLSFMTTRTQFWGG